MKINTSNDIIPLLLFISQLYSVTYGLTNGEKASRVNGEYNHTLYRPFVPYEEQNSSTGGSYNYSQYQPLTKIEKELTRISTVSTSDIERELFSIGTTFEGRNIWALKLRSKSGNNNVEKKIVVIDSGIHAREWITVSTCMWLIREFSLPSMKVKNLIEKYDWVFIPVMNPDGYAYTWLSKDKRLWRKNRSFNSKQEELLNKTKNPLCIGADINRNFDVSWGGQQAPKDDVCSNMYPGSSPFSEKEAASFAKYVLSIKKEIISYISLHCYSQKWATPWGYKGEPAKDYREMKRVADVGVESIKKFAGISYEVGSTHDVLYPSSGTSTDWVYASLNLTYTYLIEMIPAKAYNSSFMLPPEMMVMNAEDILEGILHAAGEFKEKQTDYITQNTAHIQDGFNVFIIVILLVMFSIFWIT